MKLLLVILFLVNVNLLGSKIDNKGYDKKSNQYYKQYKKEFDRLPLKNKKKILEAYYTNEAYDLGFTMAGTMFLENRGKDTSYSNVNGRNKNIHKNGMITYDCGDYGINTMTYLKSIGKATKNHKKHIEACKILSKDKLLNLALAYESHPDNITPAVMGGFNVACVQENEVKYIRKEIPKDLKAVVVVPNRAISTQLSRKTLPFKYSKEDTVFNISHSSLLTAAFMAEDWEMLKHASFDQVHQKYRMKQMPELFDVQKTSLKEGALMSTLSGSGSTLFSMAYADDSKNLEKALKLRFPHFKVFTADFDNGGVRVEI